MNSGSQHQDRIRRNMQTTMTNMVQANNHMGRSMDAREKGRLREKNERRQRALDSMEHSLHTGPNPQ